MQQPTASREALNMLLFIFCQKWRRKCVFRKCVHTLHNHSAFLSFSEEVVQQYGDDILLCLLCKSCVQRCNIFKTNGTQELNQSKHFLSHHHVGRYHIVVPHRHYEASSDWAFSGDKNIVEYQTRFTMLYILHPVLCFRLFLWYSPQQ